MYFVSGLWNQQPRHKMKFAVLKSCNLTYCFIPKAGCTNWKKMLMVLNGDVGDISQVVKTFQQHIRQTHEFNCNIINYLIKPVGCRLQHASPFFLPQQATFSRRVVR